MKPGKYYIGDLCHVFTDEEWEEVCSLIIIDDDCIEGTFTLKNGKQFTLFNTAYGDGEYRAFRGGVQIGSVGVDSGTIGCTLIENVHDVDKAVKLGLVVDIANSFYPSSSDGDMQFDNIRIYTDEGDEDEYVDSCDEDYE